MGYGVGEEERVRRKRERERERERERNLKFYYTYVKRYDSQQVLKTNVHPKLLDLIIMINYTGKLGGYQLIYIYG